MCGSLRCRYQNFAGDCRVRLRDGVYPSDAECSDEDHFCMEHEMEKVEFLYDFGKYLKEENNDR